jgi:sterol 3beta-glucosyltransferase
MRITLMAIGSRGDVQPLAALGAGLRRAGHQARVVAGDEFARLVTGAGLEFTPLGMNIQAAIAAHTDIFRFMAFIRECVLRAADAETDGIVSTFLGVSACPLARARGIPFFYAVPMPSLETREFPNPLFPPLPFGKGYNAFTYRMADGRVTRSCEDARCLFLEPRPTYLFSYSPSVVPRPADWGEFAHVTGYWFLDAAPDYHPPAGLEDFLRAGPPPVCVGFGSMLTKDPESSTALVLEALALAKRRGVLVAGWGGLKGGALSPDVFAADSIPFDWLFPRVAAAVHHAGAGTLALALRAGLPSVTVPFGMDQAFWARRAWRLGAAPEPLNPRRLTASALARAITRAVEDSEMRVRAAALAEKIRAEDGVGNAVAIIERVMASSQARRRAKPANASGVVLIPGQV